MFNCNAYIKCTVICFPKEKSNHLDREVLSRCLGNKTKDLASDEVEK